MVLVTLLVVTTSTLAVVAIYSVRGSKATLAELELQLEQSLEIKGWSLVSNQATALRSLVANHAMEDVGALVRQTKQEEEELIYGVFLAADAQPWAYVVPGAAQERPAVAGALPAGLEGVGRAGPGFRIVTRFGQP